MGPTALSNGLRMPCCSVYSVLTQASAPRGYPGLVLDDGGGDVPGSLLTAPDLSAIWENLDEFEGNEYERVVASVTLAGGAQARATVYVLRQSTGA